MASNKPLERITIVYLVGPNAYMAYKVGEGPKYVTYVHRKEDVGNKYRTFQVEKASDRYLILRGHHPGLATKLREGQEQYNQAYHEHRQARERALWKFRERWDSKHPHPTFDIPAIITPYKRRYRR